MLNSFHPRVLSGTTARVLVPSHAHAFTSVFTWVGEARICRVAEQQYRAEQQDAEEHVGGRKGRGTRGALSVSSWLKKSGRALAAQLEKTDIAKAFTASSLKTLKRVPTASSSGTGALQDGAGARMRTAMGGGSVRTQSQPLPRPFSSRFSSQLLGSVSGSFR